jgi:hypothetical protein
MGRGKGVKRERHQAPIEGRQFSKKIKKHSS